MNTTSELAATFTLDPPERRGQTFAQAGEVLGGRIADGASIIDAIPVGCTLLDTTAGGLVRGEFAGLVAAPGVGKSTVADSLIVNALLSAPDLTALVFNLETSTLVRMARIVCGWSVEVSGMGSILRCVPLGPLLRGELRPETRDRAAVTLRRLGGVLGSRLAFIDDMYQAEEIADEILGREPDLVLIDHAGLMGIPGNGGAVEKFDDALHVVTKAIREVDAAALIIHELNKQAVKGGDAGMGAVRGSARFASLAGQVLSLRRDEEAEPGESQKLWLELHKNRHGQTLQREALTLCGGLGYVNWSGVVEPLPRKTKG